MKRLWISLALLILIFVATLWNVNYLGRFTNEITDMLSQAQDRAAHGDWAAAETLTSQAQALWESRAAYLHIALIHSDTNEVYVSFHEILEFIGTRENGEYFSSNAKLMAKLTLIHKMDQLTLENIL